MFFVADQKKKREGLRWGFCGSGILHPNKETLALVTGKRHTEAWWLLCAFLPPTRRDDIDTRVSFAWRIAKLLRSEDLKLWCEPQCHDVWNLVHRSVSLVAAFDSSIQIGILERSG